MEMQRPGGAGQYDAAVAPVDRLHTQEVLYCDKYTTSLSLYNRGLTEIPDLSKCTSLQYLYLNGNQLTELPDLSVLASLRYLYLNNNQLTTLLDLSALTSLNYLYLSNNQLTELPDLRALTSLQLLDLSNNQLTEIPELSALTSLQELYLGNNQLTELTPSIAKLRNLYHLDVSYNRLVSLPVEIIQLPSSCSVNVMHNRITYIAVEVFDRFRTYLSYGCNPGYMFFYCYDYYGSNVNSTNYNTSSKDLSLLYEVLSTGWNMSVSMQYDQEEFRAQLSEHAVQEDRERLSVVVGGNYSTEDHIAVHSFGRWGAAIDWDAAANMDYSGGQYLSDVRISSSAIGSALAMSRIDHSGVSLEVSLSDSRGMEQFLATNALSWEHTDSSSGHVTATSYFDPQRARLHGPNALLSNTFHSEARHRMDKGM